MKNLFVFSLLICLTIFSNNLQAQSYVSTNNQEETEVNQKTYLEGAIQIDWESMEKGTEQIAAVSNDRFRDSKPMLNSLSLSARKNVGIIDGMYKAFATSDIPAVLGVMDEKIVWNEAENFPYADGNPYIGPDAILNGVFARIGAEWEYWNLTGISLHDMPNNQVLATMRYQARYKKNGAEIDAQAAHLWTLKNGKVVGFQQFADTKQVTDAIAK